uniref:Heat shock protein family A (Hsp70) member 12A n=1 Tax=Meleagris gallopavo TaxID=9103 RepID=A0A803XVR7_MELGA
MRRLWNLLSFSAGLLHQEKWIILCEAAILFYLLTRKNFCFLSDAVSTSAYSSPAKSLGDPGITPLSPSHIVKDSDAEDAVEQLFLVVVAIDFGTTSSGYAYSFTKEPECIHVMRRWEGGDPGVSNQKTPTTILLTPERKFHSFGYAARDFYHDLDPSESKHWLYFEKFKMKLHTTSNLTMETDLTAANGKKVKALEIFAYALQFFKEQALKELSDQAGSDFENTEVRWVITVPAIWKQPAKQFMRQAAYKTCITHWQQITSRAVCEICSSLCVICRVLLESTRNFLTLFLTISNVEQHFS